MDISTLLNRLYEKLRLGIKPGLERTLKLAKNFGDPQNKFNSIHIAGTNGKGATASFCASLLKENGFKVGLYTSPHFFEFNERIRVDGEKISNSKIIDIYDKIQKVSDEINATFFEITTIMAFIYFAEENVDYAIIETGMGGRFDSTNIVTPEVSIITSIGMDHSEFLGDTLEKIAFEKAGIIKNNVPVIISKNIDNSAKNVIIKQANEKNAEVVEIDDSYLESINYNTNLTSNFNLNNEKIIFNIPGKNQLINFLISYNAIKLALKSNPINIQKALNNLYLNTGYFGRMQKISEKPLTFIDISHNTQAIQNILDVLKIHNQSLKFNILFTCMKEKEYHEIIKLLDKISSKIIITKTNNIRNIDLELLEKSCIEQNIDYLRIDDAKFAYQKLLELHQPILITGSFFLIEELKEFVLFK